ncbi:MAG: YifB family Mg chelatase-like AAA ATPase [Planctomycetota bacterium]
MRTPTITIGCGMVQGVDAIPVFVEATARHASDGTPRLLGLVDACVREAYHRVLQAFFALELPPPRGVTTVNFAPASLKKQGSGFDLPLALALAGAAGLYDPELASGLFAFGEISLCGDVLPARGAVSVAIAARQQHAHAMVCSPADAGTCRVVDGLRLFAAKTLAEAVAWLASGAPDQIAPTASEQAGAGRCHTGQVVTDPLDSEVADAGPAAADPAAAEAGLTATTPAATSPAETGFVNADLPHSEPGGGGSASVAACADLGDIRGHHTPKLALAVAAAGGHNLLFTGPPGTGKSAMIRRLPGILPPPTDQETLEILQVHAAAGLPVPPKVPPHVRARPMRAPHHTSSAASLLGGGTYVRPGEVTLAHHGVLFLDELPEFRRDVLEAMRQPLEDGTVTVGRAHATVTMPARFLLAAARNPCPCGFLGHRHRPCICTPAAQARYRNRLSGPLLDRLDLRLEVPALSPVELRGPVEPGGTSAALRARVLAAHRRQQHRQATHGIPPGGLQGPSDDAQHVRKFVPNARLEGEALLRACDLPDDALQLVDEVLERHQQSPRGRVRLLRVARTLADLNDRESVADVDILQAASLRGLDAERLHS